MIEAAPSHHSPQWYDAIECRLYGIEKTICSLALVVMLFAVAASVCIRFFGLAIPNVAEWALVAMSPLAFVGAAMCTRAHAHISIDVIKQMAGLTVQRLARLVVALSVLVFAIAYTWFGWMIFEDNLISGEQLLDMGTPVAVPAFFLLAGMACMTFHALLECWRACRGIEPYTEDEQ